MVVCDDVRVAKGAEDGELGMELFSFLLGHLDVVNFLTTKDLGHIQLWRTMFQRAEHTWPSDFRLTFLIMPKDPCPV